MWVVNKPMVLQPAARPLRTPEGASSRTTPNNKSQLTRTHVNLSPFVTIFWFGSAELRAEKIGIRSKIRSSGARLARSVEHCCEQTHWGLPRGTSSAVTRTPG